MKAKIQAKIVGFERNATFESDSNINVVGLTKLSLISKNGKVDTRLNNAQTAAMRSDLFLKSIIASEMKIGAIITITISDEETEE